MTHVSFTDGIPETVLAELAAPVQQRLDQIDTLVTSGEQRAELAKLLVADPKLLEAWARLSALSDDPIEAYAYARVGYHRGLDALRASGWRGSGYVRSSHRSNRGFLASLGALAKTAADIGETDESERCQEFLEQLDPKSA